MRAGPGLKFSPGMNLPRTLSYTLAFPGRVDISGCDNHYKQYWRKKHNYRLSCSSNGSLLHEDNATRKSIWGRGLTGVSKQLLLQIYSDPTVLGWVPAQYPELSRA